MQEGRYVTSLDYEKNTVEMEFDDSMLLKLQLKLSFLFLKSKLSQQIHLSVVTYELKE